MTQRLIANHQEYLAFTSCIIVHFWNYKPHLNGNDGTQKRPFRRIGCSPKTGKYGIPILFIFCAEVYIIQNMEIYLFFTKKEWKSGQ